LGHKYRLVQRLVRFRRYIPPSMAQNRCLMHTNHHHVDQVEEFSMQNVHFGTTFWSFLVPFGSQIPTCATIGSLSPLHSAIHGSEQVFDADKLPSCVSAQGNLWSKCAFGVTFWSKLGQPKISTLTPRPHFWHQNTKWEQKHKEKTNFLITSAKSTTPPPISIDFHSCSILFDSLCVYTTPTNPLLNNSTHNSRQIIRPTGNVDGFGVTFGPNYVSFFIDFSTLLHRWYQLHMTFTQKWPEISFWYRLGNALQFSRRWFGVAKMGFHLFHSTSTELILCLFWLSMCINQLDVCIWRTFWYKRVYRLVILYAKGGVLGCCGNSLWVTLDTHFASAPIHAQNWT